MNTKGAVIIDSKISAISFEETLQVIDHWIKFKDQKYICVCNTHSLVEAEKNELHKHALDNANLCVADGMPLVWILRHLGFENQNRVDGPSLMLELCNMAIKKDYRIYLYGGTDETLIKLKEELYKNFSGINIVGSFSPPFKKLNASEEKEILESINSCEPDIVFVCLGCPKQEIWMNNINNRLKGIKIGVGAAFEYNSGIIKRPPAILQRIGLEWFYRLIKDPRRLWKRYLYNNPMFIYKFLKTYKRNLSKISS